MSPRLWALLLIALDLIVVIYLLSMLGCSNANPC